MQAFSISLDGMREVERRLTSDFKKGLEREGEDVKVKMLITYVHSLPNGSEEGDFLALDLGGSNFRVLLISESVTLGVSVAEGCASRLESGLIAASNCFCKIISVIGLLFGEVLFDVVYL